jgi:hypothetical protein
MDYPKLKIRETARLVSRIADEKLVTDVPGFDTSPMSKDNP